jgi:hypothetical protein
MAGSVTQNQTVGFNLDQGTPARMLTAAARVHLATMLTPVDTGDVTVSAAAAVVLPNSGAANIVESCEVVASGTAGSLGWYTVVPTGAVEAVPSTAGQGDGIATISADGTTITFPNTVTQYRVRYLPQPAVAFTASLDG